MTVGLEIMEKHSHQLYATSEHRSWPYMKIFLHSSQLVGIAMLDSDIPTTNHRNIDENFQQVAQESYNNNGPFPEVYACRS